MAVTVTVARVATALWSSQWYRLPVPVGHPPAWLEWQTPPGGEVQQYSQPPKLVHPTGGKHWRASRVSPPDRGRAVAGRTSGRRARKKLVETMIAVAKGEFENFLGLGKFPCLGDVRQSRLL